MTIPVEEPSADARRARLYRIVFKDDTLAGRAFDISLIALILTSIVVVCVQSMPGHSERMQDVLQMVEWAFTAIFTVEYGLRLLAVRRPIAYAASFFGVVDLIALLPTWLGLFIPGAQALLVVRALRLLRIFRILKLSRFLTEAETLRNALRASARKITVFLLSVATIVVIVGSVMFVIEGPGNGFTSIPASMYWAVVTLTTVGYGDIAPRTALGQVLASLVMILGYGIIAVPTGIVTSQLARGANGSSSSSETPTVACERCGVSGHAVDATFCRRCGAVLRVDLHSLQ